MSDGSTAAPPGEDVAVVCESRGAAAERVRAFLQENGLESAAWYAPRDVDDAERAIREGRVRTIVFDQPADLLRAAWERRAAPQSWDPAAVRIRFASASSEDAESQARALLAAWLTWDTRRRRLNTVGGLVLTMLALALGFVLTRIS